MGRKTKRFINASDEPLKHEWLIEMYLEYLKAEGKTPKTLKNYESDLRIFFTWYEENATLKGKPKGFEKIKVQDVIKLQASLLDKGMSINRYSRLKSVISSLSNYCENILAEDEDYEEFKNFRNIMNKVKKPTKEIVREKTILTDEQCQDYLNFLVSNGRYQQACIFSLAWASGRRKAELLEIKCHHISDDNLKWGSLYKTDKIRCKGKMQEVYILKSKFKPYFDLWMEERNRLGVPEDIDDIFIKKEDGKWRKMKESNLNYYAEIFSKEMNVDFYFHCLRHQFTTALSRQGLPDSVIKTIIGWQSMDMVQIYKDIDDDEELAKYFDENGIKNVASKTLSDL